jgi:hypothetical protein
MQETRNVKPQGVWTPDEIAREEAITRVRAERDRAKGSQERLEETLKLSRLISELRQGLPDDVRA